MYLIIDLWSCLLHHTATLPGVVIAWVISFSTNHEIPPYRLRDHANCQQSIPPEVRLRPNRS